LSAADRLDIEDDYCYIIAGVYPSSRRGVRLKLGGYAVVDGKIRRAEIR
jgi:hypothetical protein